MTASPISDLNPLFLASKSKLYIQSVDSKKQKFNQYIFTFFVIKLTYQLTLKYQLQYLIEGYKVLELVKCIIKNNTSIVIWW